ncbi:thioesterase family protein [Rhizobium sp.]
MTVVAWRGQVPAWQCDGDGRWDIRHVFGALDEARRIAASHAAANLGSVVFNGLDDSRPRAGALVEVRAVHVDGVLKLTLADCQTGEVYGSASVSGVTLAPGFAAPAAGAVAGPLGLVNAWECDVMGHMNVQFYAARLTEAEAFLAAGLGLGQTTIVRPVEHRLRFVGELRAGDVGAAAIAELGRDGGQLTARTELTGGHGLSAVAESDLVVCSDDGAPLEFPETLGAAKQLQPDQTARPIWTGGDWSPDEATLARMTALGRQEVASWEVDHTGVMPPRFFFARMASSVPYLMSEMGLTRPFMQQNGLGRAAVGYRLRYVRWPRAADCLELRSGIADAGEKNWRFRHCFLDVADGKMVAVIEAVVVLLDLTARRAVSLPDDIRRRATAISI